MNAHDEERMNELIRQSIAPMHASEPARDLWPNMLRRMDAKPGLPPWFDWVLAGGVLGFVALVPASIPVLLYYL